jgi:hypothetical protein
MRSARPGVLARGAVAAAVAGGLLLSTLPVVAGAATATKPQLAQARRALLVLSDLPKGWKASKSSNDNSPVPGLAQLAHCLGLPLSEVDDNPPSVSSPEFDSRDHLESVDDMVEVFPSAKAARADFESLASPKAPGCLAANFNGPSRSQIATSFGPTAKVGSIAVVRTPSADYAPHELNYTLFFPITTKGITLNFEITQVAYVKGADEQDITLLTAQAPFPTSLSRRVTKVAAGRL